MEGKTDPAADRYLAHLAHELRTPLNAIIGYADAMRREVSGPLPHPYADYANTIHEAGRHLLEMAEDLLARAGGQPPTSADGEPFDAAEAAAWATDLLRLQARAAGVGLEFSAAGTPLMVRGERRAIVQMVTNLTANALRHTPAGGLVQVAASRAAGDLVLSVTDGGPGFAPGSETAGLGLGLVRGLAVAAGGRLEIHSEAGRGALATLVLPIMAAPR